ncbi:MAG: hypothetical protein ABEJ26_06410 [Halosimplex sp.]
MSNSESGQKGLYEKYEVRKDGELQTGCFVLKPASDPAAREALKTYARETDNEELAEDIDELVGRLEAMDEWKDTMDSFE